MKYVRIYEVMDPTRLSIIKSSLTSSGVDYRVQFEHGSIDPAISGRSGTQIEVAETDYEKAQADLANAGVDLNYAPEEDRFGFVDWLANFTEGLPLIGGLPAGERMLSFVVGLVLVAAVVVLWLYAGEVS